MKILLTHGYFLAEDPKEMQIMRPYVPLGILYVSAFLEQNGYSNDIFDSTFQKFEDLENKLITEKPEVLAIYTNLMTKINVLKIISFVKARDELKYLKIILGGPEVKSHAENFLNYGADILVIGEGEETMLELMNFYSGRSIHPSLHCIHGLAFLEARDIITTPARTLLKDINLLPFPNRKKVNLQKYFSVWKSKHGQSSISISTMRGCPYTCKWCSRAVYGDSYRRRSPELVVNEIEEILKDYSPDSFWFVDDVFTISHKWLEGFVAELEKREIKIVYETISRADRMNEHVIQLLKKSGCFRVWIGAESGSQKIINAMDRRVSVHQVRDMIQLTQRYGIQAGTFIMLGYPGETQEDIEETIRHLKISDPDLYTITIAYPIKGTPLYEEVESDFTASLPWSTSTDRDIDFKRTYSRQYYNHAISLIYNEVNYQKECKKSGLRKAAMKYKLNAYKNRSFMLFQRIKTKLEEKWISA